MCAFTEANCEGASNKKYMFKQARKTRGAKSIAKHAIATIKAEPQVSEETTKKPWHKIHPQRRNARTSRSALVSYASSE